MMRLIQQQALQPVDSHSLVEPARHRVDVGIGQLAPRLTVRHDGANHVCALIAVSEEADGNRHGAGGRPAAGQPCEGVHEREKGGTEQQPVHENHRLEPRSQRGDVAIDRAGEKMRQPVVTKGLVAEKGIVRRNVTLADLSRHGHRPDEISGEVGPVGLAVRDRLANMVVGRPCHERKNQHHERRRNDVAPVKDWKTKAWSSEASRSNNNQPRQSWPNNESDPVL